MSTSPPAAQAVADNRHFWNGIARLPEAAQKSFWDAGDLLSRSMGADPLPRTLQFDLSSPPAGMSWWERMLFFAGQSQYNQSVAQMHTGMAVADGAGWLWGALQGDFNKSPTTGQVITGGIISMIPIVDQACDVRDVIANCLELSDEKSREDGEKWTALGLSCIGFLPEIGSAIKTVSKVAMRKGLQLLELLKHMEWFEQGYKKLKVACPWGFAPIDWLRKFDWVGNFRKAGSIAKQAFENALTKTGAAARYAIGTIKERLTRLADLFKAIAAKIVDTMAELGRRIKAKVDELLGGAKKEAGNYDATPGGPNKHGHGDKDPSPGSPRPRSNYSPPLKSRHSIRNVKQGGRQEGTEIPLLNRISDMNADVAAINRGEGSRTGNLFTINGRNYELTNGDHLVPHSGPGFHELNRGEFDALGIFNKFGDTQQARDIAAKVAGSEGATRALEVWRLGK